MALVTKNFSDIITFTRTSTATFFNSSGVLTSAGNNVPRFDYNPATLAAQGLLIEEQRTNLRTFSESILTTNVYGANNSTLTSTTAQTPIQGLTTVTKFAMNAGANTGNSSDGFNFGAGIMLAASTAHTQSIIVKEDGASVVRLRSNVSGQLYDIPIAGPAPAPTGAVTASSVQQLGNGWARISWSFTTAASGVPGTRADFWSIKTDVADGAAGFLITAAQLEAGAFPTSYIPTTTTALTRSADVASVNTLSPWYNSVSGTLFAEFSSYASGSRAIVGITDGTLNNRIQFFANAGDPYTIASRLVSGGTQTNPANTGSIAVGAVGKAALAYAVGTNQGAMSVNGGAPTTSSPAAIAVGVNTLELGKGSALATMSGHLRRVTYYPRNLSSAELQTITA